MIKVFEEYKYFKAKNLFSPYYHNEKDPDEPFFNKDKKAYKARIEDERIAERERRNREESDRYYRQGIELRNRQTPIVLRYIDIMENHPDEILKVKYTENEYNSVYGILLKDKTKIISAFSKRSNYFISTKINDEYLSNTKERKANKEAYPLGEEDWNDNDITPSEILGKLVKDYVTENEIIF